VTHVKAFAIILLMALAGTTVHGQDREKLPALKPVYSAVKVYWPVASWGIVYSPLSLTIIVRLSFVPTFVMAIVAPGSTAPVSSVTRPTTVARNPCAASRDANSKIAIDPFRKHVMLASFTIV